MAVRTGWAEPPPSRETRTRREAPGGAIWQGWSQSVGRGLRHSLAQSPPPPTSRGPGDPYSAPLGLSFPISTVGTMTPTLSSWDKELVRCPRGTQAVRPSPPQASSLQSAGPALATASPGRCLVPEGPISTLGEGLLLSPGCEGQVLVLKNCPVLSPPTGKSGGQLVPLPGSRAVTPDCPASWVPTIILGSRRR